MTPHPSYLPPSLTCPQADGTVVVPPFDNSLNGITVQRMMELLPQVGAVVEGGRGLPCSAASLPLCLHMCWQLHAHA